MSILEFLFAIILTLVVSFLVITYLTIRYAELQHKIKKEEKE